MKQVLLLGDSIRLGYCGYVKELLSDKAEVIYPKENCLSSQYIIMNVTWGTLCDKERVSAVHFNCGHWDMAHFENDPEPLTSLAEYRKNLGVIVRCLRAKFPNAKLIFATTTPMNPDYTGKLNRTTEDIMRYNAEAKRVMEEMGVEVNDLFELAKAWDKDNFVDECHMNPQSYEILASRVSERIAKYI